MKEVSCRFFEALLRDLEDRKIELAPLVLGTDYTLAHLRNKNERIDWPAFVRIMENGRGFWTKEQLIEIGERSTEGTAVQFIGVVARLRFSVNGFYHWVADPDGIAKQMFHCLAVSCRDAGPARVVIELIMREGYSPNHELFWVSQGTYAAMPRMLGATKSTVSAELLPDGVRFHVQYVEPRGPAALFRRIVTWPFNARQAADELNDAHQSLQARYSELDATREAVDRQRAVLQTAYRVGQRVLGARDVDATIAAVVEELVDDPQIAGGELRWGAEREYRAGQIGTTASAISVALRSGQAVVGSVRVWPRRPDEDDHARTLLELVGPTVALAINNSKAYHELAEHQLTLERRVDERTRDLSVARDELAATVTRLEEVQESRERLFQNISHEFRTPLALILLSVDTLMTAARSRDDTSGTAHLGTVTTASRKLVRMVDELLLLAAGRERELRVHPEPLDLHGAITTAAAGWRLAADAAAQTLIVECPTDANVLADPIALERVLANLLSNAVKFSPPGGRITITVGAGAGADDEEDRLQVAVADTGIGIDDELRARLFGRFEQGKGGIASRGGSGIGLSLARELVRAHGGDIDCLPNPGGGTIFRFSLARSTIRPTAHHGVSRLAPGDFGVATESTNVPQRFEPAGTSLGTILLAEDELALAASIAGVLAGDYTILIAHDGATALALAEQHHPDLLITDVQMPGMDGFELTRRFRDIPGVPPAPVLLLTARAGLDDRLVGLGTGAVDYLTKPFDPDELRARVRSQLAHRELTRQLYDAEKLASLGALSAGLAHELRNPANGIVNAVAPLKELLPPELSDPDHPVTQLIDVMAECAEQVGYLSRQLLGFRRSGELELRRVAIGDVIDRALANASAALTGIDLRTHTTYNGPIRCATPVMSQVLVNLLENAAHAAGPGGWVEIATSKRPGRVTLEVTDSGPGVPLALRDRIFEPFFTTKPPGQGTGLGLSTSRDLVQRHGGTLELRTRGERTVFAVDLPEPPEVS